VRVRSLTHAAGRAGGPRAVVTASRLGHSTARLLLRHSGSGLLLLVRVFLVAAPGRLDKMHDGGCLVPGAGHSGRREPPEGRPDEPDGH